MFDKNFLLSVASLGTPYQYPPGSFLDGWNETTIWMINRSSKKSIKGKVN